MDYVVGSVAALITGNVTPNRPKVLKRALTPMKHQPSPNFTPKSELVSDRSIFLSPTMQKKKAIAKKSPKRIFQNPELEITNDDGNNTNKSSPKVDKVKKHLKDDLSETINMSNNILSPQSPKNKMNKSVESPSPKKKLNMSRNMETSQSIQLSNENTPKKKKKKLSNISDTPCIDNLDENDTSNEGKNDFKIEGQTAQKRRFKTKGKVNKTNETFGSTESLNTEGERQGSTTIEKKKKKGKDKNKQSNVDSTFDNNLEIDSNIISNKENERKIKKKKNKKNAKNNMKTMESKAEITTDDNEAIQSENTAETQCINPNAITNEDTDSEHDSDDNIESENEENNRAILDTGPGESSDDDEEEQKQDIKKGKSIVDKENVKEHVDTEEEVKRTLFVGNVPFSSKCKKEIKKIFSKYGDIESVRIRTVPVKDARVTPKLAVIKKELHPDRSTVNVYVKYKDPSSVNEALVENNTVLNEHHLRVARSDVTGSEHDPRCSIFVGNIPFALEDEGLRAKFENCGEIESVRIIRDRKTNAGKGFGYVNFKSKDGVELALALTEEDLTIKNRILRVKRCTQPTMGKQRHQNVESRQQTNQAGRNYRGRGNINQRGNRGNFQMNRSGKAQFSNDRFQKRDQQSTDSKSDGAYRRIMSKRKPQDGDDGPANKRQRHLNQPNKEKKVRKEFVGLTSEKKKFQKRKLNKGDKKKKALSEILTKPRQ